MLVLYVKDKLFSLENIVDNCCTFIPILEKVMIVKTFSRYLRFFAQYLSEQGDQTSLSGALSSSLN